MKNITFFFFAFFFLAFFNAANSQSGGQSPVSGLGYAPDSNYIIISKLYRGRNGVAVWMHKDSIDWLEGFTPGSVIFAGSNGRLTENNNSFRYTNTTNAKLLRINSRLDFNTTGEEQRTNAASGGEDFFVDLDPDFEATNNNVVLSLLRFRNRGASGTGIRRLLFHSEDIAGGDRAVQLFESGLKLNRGSDVILYNKFTPPTAWLEIGEEFTNKPYIATYPQTESSVVSIATHELRRDSTIIRNEIKISQYNGSTRNNSAFFAPVRPLYTDASGNMLQAPLDSFQVYNPATASQNNLYNTLNSIYSAATTGVNIFNSNGSLTANRTLAGTSFNLDFTGMGNFTATGSGSATYRFNLYPSSSLPVLLEQTSAGDTAYLQLRASLGRATLRATQDIYLEAANSVFVSTLEGSSTGIVSARPTGELIRRERAFVNASINTDTFTVALSPTEINLPFNDDVSEGFNVSGDSLIYTGTDTAYFEIGYYQDIEFLESATGTYRLNLSVYQNGVNIPRSEMEHLIYFQNTTTEPILTAGKTFIVQLINGDVLNIRQNGTTGINAAIHNLSITANKIE